MRLPKSERVQLCFSITIMVAAPLLFYGLPPLLARALSNHETKQIEQKKNFYPESAVINLPTGEKFVLYGPVIEGIQTYISEKRPVGEKPRRLTVFRPGITTERSWEVYVYIQEH